MNELEILISTKDKIKGAIEDKGVSVDVGLIDYDDKIRLIRPGIHYYIPDGTSFSHSEFENISVDLSSLRSMANLFWECHYLVESPILDVTNITSTMNMFRDCFSLIRVILNGDPSKIENVDRMFLGAGHRMIGTFYYDNRYDYTKIIGTVPSTWDIVPYDINKPIDYSNERKTCTGVVNMNEYFSSISTGGNYVDPLQSYIISNLDTSSAETCIYTFQNCANLKKVNPLDLSNAVEVMGMFQGCSSLERIELNNISNIVNATRLFSECHNLSEVKLSGNVNPNINTTNMFYNVNLYSEGILYYDSRYDYGKIIDALPENWTAVPFNYVEEV